MRAPREIKYSTDSSILGQCAIYPDKQIDPLANLIADNGTSTKYSKEQIQNATKHFEFMVEYQNTTMIYSFLLLRLFFGVSAQGSLEHNSECIGYPEMKYRSVC